LTSATNLASELTELGEYQAARELNEDTLARRRRVLGDDHPETMGSAALDLILRGLAIGGEPEWMAEFRKARKRPGAERRRTRMKGEANHWPHGSPLARGCMGYVWDDHGSRHLTYIVWPGQDDHAAPRCTGL
jgi:hypothetical protein